MNQIRFVCVAALLCVTAALGCETKAQGNPAPAASSTAPLATAQVARIVFLDKKEACDCTRKRVQQAWALLDRTMKAVRVVPVERIFVDTQAATAAGYQAKRPAQALPAVYFLDDKSGVIDMLQGDLEEEPVATLLRKGR
jgi:hypothetical protein